MGDLKTAIVQSSHSHHLCPHWVRWGSPLIGALHTLVVVNISHHTSIARNAFANESPSQYKKITQTVLFLFTEAIFPNPYKLTMHSPGIELRERGSILEFQILRTIL